MSEKPILFKVENNLATITLNRPKAANGLNMELGKELYEIVRQIDLDGSVRAVLINANGKFFSAGGDLKYMEENFENLGPTVKHLADELHRCMAILARMEKPLIVAVNGMAAGAGFSIAISGDIVIAAESAQFTLAYTAAGLSPDGGASHRLPRLVGLRRATELLFLNRRLSAQEALEWGLVTQVVPDEELNEKAEKIALKLASGPTGSFATVKKLLLASYDNSLETQLEMEARGIAACASSENGKEGISAFLEKRKPNFRE